MNAQQSQQAPLELHKGQMAGKAVRAQLQPERSIRDCNSFSPGAGITPLTPRIMPQHPSHLKVW